MEKFCSAVANHWNERNLFADMINVVNGLIYDDGLIIIMVMNDRAEKKGSNPLRKSPGTP